MGTLRDDHKTFLIYLAKVFLEFEMLRIKFIEEIKTHILCSVTFFPENRAVYETMWKNTVVQGRLQMTIWHMRNACWITKGTDTHLE